MWPGGRICSNCALARKRSGQSASTAWIFTGGDGKTGGLQYRVGVGELGGGGGEGVMSQERGVLYYFWYRKDMAFAVLDEQNQTWAGDDGPCVRVGLQWFSLSSGRYVWRRGLAEFLTIFTHFKGASFFWHCNTLLWWWWIFKALEFNKYIYHRREIQTDIILCVSWE